MRLFVFLGVQLVLIVSPIVRLLLFLALTAGAVVAIPLPAHADPLLVGQISNTTTDVSGQFGLDFTYDNDAATFVFTNDVDNGLYASITAIYFAKAMDGILDFGTEVQSETSGVSFSPGASPPGPGGFNWGSPPHSVVGYTTDSDPGVTNGIDASSESLTIVIDFVGGKGGSDLLDFFGTTTLTGQGIGFHVQSVGGDGGDSDWYGVVPEPTSITLLGLGLAGLAVVRRRRRV